MGWRRGYISWGNKMYKTMYYQPVVSNFVLGVIVIARSASQNVAPNHGTQRTRAAPPPGF
jgi:hypothetical protein